jgi:hypothetical protein
MLSVTPFRVVSPLILLLWKAAPDFQLLRARSWDPRDREESMLGCELCIHNQIEQLTCEQEDADNVSLLKSNPGRATLTGTQLAWPPPGTVEHCGPAIYPRDHPEF